MVNCIYCDHENLGGSRRCRNCGAELPDPTGSVRPIDDDLVVGVRSLMDKGQKIEAIKLYRGHTGAGLKESKEAVEAIGRNEHAPARPVEGDLPSEVFALLEQGQKIEAIKRYRERTGAGLKESKDAVEAMAERRGTISPQGKGCFGLVIIALGLLAGTYVCAVARENPPGVEAARSGFTWTRGARAGSMGGSTRRNEATDESRRSSGGFRPYPPGGER